MKKNQLWLFLLLIPCLVAFDQAAAITGTMPPTRAFYEIIINGQSLIADNYRGKLTIIAGDNIELTPNPNSDSLTISAIVGESTDTNTAQLNNTGTNSLVKNRYNATLWNLYGLKAGSNTAISLVGNDLEISASAPGTGNATALNDLGYVSNVNQTKGNLFFANGQQWSGLKVGSNNQVLTADSTTAAGIKWTTPAGGGNASALNDLGDVINSSPSYGHILQHNGNNFINKRFQADNQTQTNDFFLQAYNNQTGDWTRLKFSINSISSTCSGSNKVSGVSIDNATGYVIITCSSVSGGPVSLGSNLTTTSTAAFTTIFTIPLTANSGNAISGVLVAETNTAGAAVQAGARLSAATQTGFCLWETPTTATANTIDYLVLSTTTAETGETVWLPAANVPGVIKFTCSTKGGGSPNLLIEFQAEVASTVTIRAGSHYTKTP